jgi:hypothetical protein
VARHGDWSVIDHVEPEAPPVRWGSQPAFYIPPNPVFFGSLANSLAPECEKPCDQHFEIVMVRLP